MAAPFDLTTIARVKALMPVDVSDHDALISGQLIPQWSARVAEMLGREVAVAARTQTFRLRRFQRLIPLPAYPVTAVSSVSYGQKANDLESLTEHEDWFLDPDARHLRLTEEFHARFDYAVLSVTWTGGMAATTDAFVSAYPDIAGALDMQIVHALNRRRSPGGTTEVFGGGSIRHEATLEVLPELTAAVALHERRWAL